MENCNSTPEPTLKERMLSTIRDSLQPAYRMSLDRHMSPSAEKAKCERTQEPKKEYTQADKQNLLNTASNLLNNAIAAKGLSRSMPFDASVATGSQKASEAAAKAGLDLARACKDWGEFNRLVIGKNPDLGQYLPIIQESMIAQNGSDPFSAEWLSQPAQQLPKTETPLNPADKTVNILQVPNVEAPVVQADVGEKTAEIPEQKFLNMDTFFRTMAQYAWYNRQIDVGTRVILDAGATDNPATGRSDASARAQQSIIDSINNGSIAASTDREKVMPQVAENIATIQTEQPGVARKIFLEIYDATSSQMLALTMKTQEGRFK